MYKSLVATTSAVSSVAAAFLVGAGVVMADDQAMANMLREIASPLGFEETLDKLEENAKAQGWKVPKKWKVNFQKNLEHVTGVDIGKNQVIKMCEPYAAAKLLVQDRYKILTAMMPCTIAVYEKSDGKTYISLMNLDLMGAMYGGDVAEMAKELGPQMDAMVNLK